MIFHARMLCAYFIIKQDDRQAGLVHGYLLFPKKQFRYHTFFSVYPYKLCVEEIQAALDRHFVMRQGIGQGCKSNHHPTRFVFSVGIHLA